MIQRLQWGYVSLFLAVGMLAPSIGFSGYGDSNWIISGGTSASVDLQSVSAGSTRNINGIVLLGHSLGSGFEVNLLLDYLSSTTTGSSTVSILETSGELLWCLSGGHADAFYVGPRAGVSSVNSGSSTTNNTIFGGVIGKRFSLIGPLSYDPNVAAIFTQTSAGTSSPNFHIVPLQFTLIL